MEGVKLFAVLLLIEAATFGVSNGEGVVVTPSLAVKAESSYVTFKCSVDMPDVQRIFWTRQDGSVPTTRSFTYPPNAARVSYLLMYRLSASDSGVYVCHAIGGGRMAQEVATLTVASSKPVSPCLARPCQNGAHCLDIKTPTITSYVCMCRIGYNGRNCDSVIAPTTTVAPPTTTPVPVTTVDPCASSPCSNSGRCAPQGDGSFTCACEGSYTGALCDVYDNCANSPCENNGVCINLSNQSLSCGGMLFECACASGFTGSTCDKRDLCSSSPCFNGARCVNVDDVSYDCVCMDGYVGERCERMPFDGCGKYGQLMRKRELRDFFYTETSRSSPPAADIVFVVDESGSMVTEHKWLERVSSALDSSLQSNRIGVRGVPNQFGLVGFARDDKMDVTGRIVHMDNGCKFGQASHFQRATSRLALNGRLEDMYLGIIMALDHYSFRPGMACQIIGVTDEGRSPLPPSANHRDATVGNVPYEYEYMLRRLNETRCVLNVVVNQKMESGGVRGLGVGSNGEGYVEVGGGNFRVDPGQGHAIADSGHGSTDRYYTRLALATHGGAWDLNKLRQGGDTAMAFTKAFVHLKQREISKQLCERCECDTGPVASCRPGCLGEQPVAVVVESFYSQLSEAAVNEGGAALFECQAGGDPVPTCTWTRPDGSPLPESARFLGERNCTLMLPDVSSISCVQCVASNIEGTTESSMQCLDYAATCEMEDGRKIFHGSSARNYSEIKLEDLRTIPFSSALVVMVVDESRSMIGEHRWLRTTMPALEKNLKSRGVGTRGRANQYALVGFASPRHGRLGRIISVGPNGRHCGSAGEVSAAMSNLRQDGRKEDGYAAIGMALDSVSCLQETRDGEATALQVILVTDEDRDVLKPQWDYDAIRQAIMRRGGVLNVVVKNQFQGKDANMRSVRAMGIDRRQRAVIVDRQKNDFHFLPFGMATKDSGHGTTERDYVKLATHTGGGAWDLTMLRDGSYREAFTKGFIAAKVEEIQVQLLSRCEECACSNGTSTCAVLPNINSEEACMNPAPNAELQVSILGEASAVAGTFAKLECESEGVIEEGDRAVIWDPHPVSALQYNEPGTDKHYLEFAATAVEDAGMYRCVGRNKFGQSAAVVDFNVAPSDTNPFRGVTFGTSSGSSARHTSALKALEAVERPDSSAICVRTTNVHTHEPRGGGETVKRIRAFTFGRAASSAPVEIHCVARTSDVEFGFRHSYEHGELVFSGELPDARITKVGNYLRFVPNELAGADSFQVGCRVRGSGEAVDCAANTCVSVSVMSRRLLIFPKEKICPNNLGA